MAKREYKRKYTRELLEAAVRESTSVLQVMGKIGAPKSSGGAHAWTKALIKEYKLDTSHFLGQAHYKGQSSFTKKSPKEILVIRTNGRREDAHRLRRALVESGITYECKVCSQPPTWNGKPLTLQVDHINGDPLDNRINNLRFICPHCHTQTNNWGTKNLND